MKEGSKERRDRGREDSLLKKREIKENLVGQIIFSFHVTTLKSTLHQPKDLTNMQTIHF